MNEEKKINETGFKKSSLREDLGGLFLVPTPLGNLKDITLAIPRNQLVIFTGLSGSGKSTLAIDVIFQECQRQYLEAIGLQGINKPKIDFIRNLSPAIMITQIEANKNPRSTVGTVTDIYTDLRMVYEKLGVRICPNCNEMISAAECKEETKKADGKFYVFMYCNHCHYKMEKLTRTMAIGTCAPPSGIPQVAAEQMAAAKKSLSISRVFRVTKPIRSFFLV